MDKIRGSVFAGLGTGIFAVNFVSMKVLLENLPAMSTLFLRFSVAMVSLFLFLAFKKADLKVEKHDYKPLFITGLLGMFAYYVLFSFSLRFISASVACLLCSLIPIITLFCESFIKKVKLEPLAVISLLISTYGVYLVIGSASRSHSSSSALSGVILMLFAICSWIAYTFKTEYLLSKYDDMKVLAYQNMFAVIVLIPLSAFELPHILNANFSASQMLFLSGNVLFVGVLGSAVAYYAFILGIKHLGVAISSAYMNIMPAITMATSYFVLGEEVTPQKIAGCILVIAAVFIITFKDDIKNTFVTKKAA
ncbi:Permease of the drug/metabolite transporter (DMT) superfamily [Peptoclostridium litorale DSM 5388]|uniref:EamA domain-containing protein n=1 Tax=Peptoclostridium litorale DSM 5388 TaxID=1121324 RepID=A0A069RD78_PEPLI|nr:DMT family transporter [Peptoclostridium litorale]KDR94996.1 hypothetical protein CLIT_11c00230 [Peptoclostridium litorale DSM 5388]SIN76850.1 Permease of the drug/metabolite transporter (DMT) superfamily [Peptoclostridium litorale DSM 5388]